MLVDFTGSLSSLTHESTHSLSTLYLNKVFVFINMEIVTMIIATLSLSGFCTIIVITTFVYLVYFSGVFGGRGQLQLSARLSSPCLHHLACAQGDLCLCLVLIFVSFFVFVLYNLLK